MKEQKYQVVEPGWWKGYTIGPWRIPLWEKEDDALDDFYASGRHGMLEIGTTFVVVTTSENMTKIRTDTGMEGWIMSYVLIECPLYSDE